MNDTEQVSSVTEFNSYWKECCEYVTKELLAELIKTITGYQVHNI